MINYYEVLGVKKEATTIEIKEAYSHLLKKYKDSDNIIVNSLKEAKDVLLSKEQRTEYDEILEEIKYSKQFSVKKEETYYYLVKEFKEKYADIKKIKYFFNYLKNSYDNFIIKLLKAIGIFINFILFVILKGIIFGFLYLLYLGGSALDYVCGFLMLMAVLGLFLKYDSPNYIPFLGANVEMFLYLSIITFIIMFSKEFIIDKSFNIYAYASEIESKIFMKIIN